MKGNIPGGNLFNNSLQLPGVTGVEISRVRFEQPMSFYLRGRLVEYREAVQLLVRTTSPLPARNLPPIIFVGDVPVEAYEPVGNNLYRFFAYDVERLEVGAPISIGWPFAPEAKIPTNFLFNFGKLIS